MLFSTDRDAQGIGGADGILGGDFVLQSSQGPVALEDFRGKVVLLYFGFLSCPEVCPASMSIYQQTMAKLSESERAEVQPILISIDPARDSVEALEEFTNYFGANILGLTGTHEEIVAVTQDYGAYFKNIESASPDSEYAFAHTSRYFVINQQGKLVDAMRHSTTANELSARIRTLL